MLACLFEPRVLKPTGEVDGGFACHISTSICIPFETCTGNSIDELTEDLAKYQTWIKKDDLEWKTAALVCKEDGREMRDMENVKSHYYAKHGGFYLIPANDGDKYYRCLNMDKAEKLYKEIQQGDVAQNVENWFETRQQDLEIVAFANCTQLGERLNLSLNAVLDFQGGIIKLLEPLDESLDDSLDDSLDESLDETM